MRQRRRLRKRLARYLPGRRRRAAIDRQLIIAEGALFGRPSLEETPFGGLLVISHHNVELTPLAPGQAPASEGCCLKSQKQRQQCVCEQDRPAANPEPQQSEI